MKSVFASLALIATLSMGDYALAENEVYNPGSLPEGVAPGGSHESVNTNKSHRLHRNTEDGSYVVEVSDAGAFDSSFTETMLLYNNAY